MLPYEDEDCYLRTIWHYYNRRCVQKVYKNNVIITGQKHTTYAYKTTK